MSRQRSSEFIVRVDSNERYPWRFPDAVTERGAVPAGDYALMDGDRILAVMEGKTLDNLLSDFGMMPCYTRDWLNLASMITMPW